MTKHNFNDALDFLSKYKKIPALIEASAESFVSKFYYDAIDDIVGNFEQSYPIVTVKTKRNNLIKYHTDVDDIWTYTPLGTPVTMRELFYYVNNGTSTRVVSMPIGFANESFPGTTYTTYQQYNRSEIYYDANNNNPGIEERDWITQIASRQQVLERLGIRSIIKRL